MKREKVYNSHIKNTFLQVFKIKVSVFFFFFFLNQQLRLRPAQIKLVTHEQGRTMSNILNHKETVKIII